MSLAMLDDADLSDIDEALRHLSLVPVDERGTAWHAYSDALLEERAHHKNERGHHGQHH
jgi:hypothetical protein